MRRVDSIPRIRKPRFATSAWASRSTFGGEGRAFCAGADLSAGASTFDLEKRSDKEQPKGGVANANYSDEAIRDGGGRVTLRIYESLKPVIAAS